MNLLSDITALFYRSTIIENILRRFKPRKRKILVFYKIY